MVLHVSFCNTTGESHLYVTVHAKNNKAANFISRYRAKYAVRTVQLRGNVIDTPVQHTSDQHFARV